ncbi:MAG: hypothetical protein IJA26_02570, partial [Clostridia bacterium]|nr:hypothetical protein [Clostridia bacterium]
MDIESHPFLQAILCVFSPAYHRACVNLPLHSLKQAGGSAMNEDIRLRVTETAQYILKTGATVRSAARR